MKAVWEFADNPKLASCTLGPVRVFPFDGIIIAPMIMPTRQLYKILKEGWQLDERLALYPMPLRKQQYRRRWWFFGWRESVVVRYEPQGGWELV